MAHASSSFRTALDWVRPRLAGLERHSDLAALWSFEQGHQFDLKAMPLNHNVDALWFKFVRPTGIIRDLVIIGTQQTPAEQEHAILHETSHMLLGHQRGMDDVAQDDLRTILQRLFPTVDVATYLTADLPNEVPSATCYCRSDYAHPAEQEAETLASLIEQEWDAVVGTGWIPSAWTTAQDSAFVERYDDLMDTLS